jgi:cytochrome b pre-mRNA-processing protein 3
MRPLGRRLGEIEALMLKHLFRPSPAREAGEALYAASVRQSREPGLYEAFATPDTVEGRFEIYTLHIVLVIERLASGGEAAKTTSQALFDTYVKALDHALREMGVGDLSVGKKMRKLGEALYGRMKNYYAAFAALPDRTPLRDLLTRTVYDGEPRPEAGLLADYVVAQRQGLAEQPLETLIRGQVDWRAP